jgi:thiol-disulfide isomerase/thioredoxin
MKASLLFGLVLVFLLFTLTLKEGFTSSPSDLMNNPKKIFVLFYNNNCSHCKELKPAWDKVESAHDDKMTSIDLTNSSDKNVEELSKKFNINAYPTMLVIENGKVSDTYNGGRTEDELTNYVKNM